MKVQNVEIKECNPIHKTSNTYKNQSTSLKINIVVENIIHEEEPDLTSFNHLIYASAVISTELCNLKIKAPKRNFLNRNTFKNKHSSFSPENAQKCPKQQQCKDFQIKKTED